MNNKIAGNALELYKNYYKDAEYGNERYCWVMENFFAKTENKCILEVGCGVGALLHMLKEKNRVYGIDSSETGLKRAGDRKIESYLLDVSKANLPFPDNYFDIAICLETIEHLENPYHCLKEIRRVLKQQGLLLISIPNPKMLHPYFYPGLFTIKNFKQLLGLTSFKVKRIVGWGQVTFSKRLLNFLKKRNNFLNRYLYNIVYYFVRKINMLMRKHLGTPLAFAHCFNFECTNEKRDCASVSIEKELAQGAKP